MNGQTHAVQPARGTVFSHEKEGSTGASYSVGGPLSRYAQGKTTRGRSPVYDFIYMKCQDRHIHEADWLGGEGWAGEMLRN